MPTITHCYRRGPVYYWRRWTPEPARFLIQIALGVKDRGTARRLSSRLTAQSDMLFAAWGTRTMNRQELQTYLGRCLDRYGSEFHAIAGGEHWLDNYWRHLSLGHATLLIAKRGVSATLLKREAEAINREWESEVLAERVQQAIRFVVDQHFAVDSYLSGGVEAASLSDREPTERDAEQASACRLLAQAADHFRKARSYGLEETRIDALICQCVDPASIPVPQGGTEPLRHALLGALTHLRERAEMTDRAASGEQSDLALFDDLIYPPSEWAFHLAQRGERQQVNSGMRELIEQLLAALEQLPDQIEDARQAQRESLYSLFAVRPTGEEGPQARPAPVHAVGASEALANLSLPEPRRAAPLRDPAPSALLGQAGTSRTFVALGDDLIAKKVQDQSWDDKTARQARALYSLFARVLAEEHGITTFADLRQSHLYAYDQFMRVLHNNYGTSPADKTRTIAQLREISRHKPLEQRGLAVPTRNRHLTQLAALLDEAATIGEQLDPGLNLTRLRGKKVGRARDQRSVPAEEQIDAFFRSPVFMGCAGWRKPHVPGDLVFHRAAYFGPILAYYQGMRREEYCGLAVSDVIADNGPHPYLHVMENDFRGLKNVQSERNLALHSELIRLGFLDYVQAIKQAGHERLFPDLYSPGSSSLLGDRLYKELAPLGRKLRISPHQFRHIFNDELKQQRVTQEFRAEMLGHGGDSETTERYCNPLRISVQIEDLHKLVVRTAHLERKPIQLLPWVLRGEVPPWSRASKRKKAGGNEPEK